MTKRPNLIFIMSDDHAAHSISAYGSRVNHTPNIDRIAAEGVRMDAVFCTNSICTPSRASLLTGTYSHVNAVPGIFSELDYRVPSYVQVLQDAGYATAIFGKWHLGESAQAQPRGFDEWLVFPGQGVYHDPVMIGPDGEQQIEGYATDIVTDLSLDWLGRHADDDAPFCLMVHHKAPHRPWDPHPRHADLYPVGSIPEPETFYDDHATRSNAVKQVNMSIADALLEQDYKEPMPAELEGDENRDARARWKYQRYMRDYLQCVQAIDDSVGSILDYLDDNGLAENTIVVYTSDQGFFLGDHAWFDKRLMFDESLLMPTLIRWPAEIEAGSRCEAMVTNVDFAETFLDMCGLSGALPTSQGSSFRNVLRGDVPDDWQQAVYYRYWEHDDPNHHVPAHYGIRTATHKLICYYGDGLDVPGSSDVIFPTEWEMYDLVADPHEMTNIYGDPAYADLQAQLAVELADLQARVGDRPYEGPGTPHPEWTEGFQEHSGQVDSRA